MAGRRHDIGPRHRLARPTRSAGARAWFQLVFLLVALVTLIFFLQQIGEGTAGCFTSISAPQAVDEPAAVESPPGKAAQGTGPRAADPLIPQAPPRLLRIRLLHNVGP